MRRSSTLLWGPMMKFVDTRASLLVGVRDAGNRQAWEEFVELYAPLVYAYAVRNRLQDADAADFTQDAMLNLMRALRSFDYDRSRGTFRGWLVTVLRNHLNRYWEKSSRLFQGSGDSDVFRQLSELPTHADDEAWESEVKLSMFHWAAQRVRVEFRPNSWNAFWQTTVEGQAIDTVAQQLSMSTGAVYVARSRVLARIRYEIQVAESEWGF